MGDRTYAGQSPQHDADDPLVATGFDLRAHARTLLGRLAVSPGGITPDKVAAVLAKLGFGSLRNALLTEVSANWGLSGVQATLAAEERLRAGIGPASAEASRQKVPAGTTEPASSAADEPPVPAGAAAAPATGHQPTGAVAPATAAAPLSHPSAVTAHRPAIDRAVDLARLGAAHLGAIETALLPAYHGAVAAIDTAAVRTLALQIVGGVARIVEAQAQVVQLVPAVDAGPHAAHASTESTDPFAPDPGKLAALTSVKAELDAAVQTRVPRLAVQVSPQLFGEAPVAGHLEPPPHVRDVLAQLAYEAGLVVQLLEEADAITQLVHPIDPDHGTNERASDADRAEAVDHLERWRSRPINFLFLARVLTVRGVWPSLQGATGLRGHTATELERKVRTQAHETGATAEVGPEWDVDEAHALLSYGPTDWTITDEDAGKVLEMLARAEPHTRAGLVKQLHRMGRLPAMCERLPWGQVKALWESIDDKEASALLEPYWADKGGGKSLGKQLDEQDHWYTSALNRFLDLATVGAKPRIDAAYDAREAGQISDGEYHGSVAKSVGRAGLILAAMAVTGGAAGALGAGAAEGLELGTLGTAAMTGAAAGAGASVAGHFVGDVYDQIADGKQGFDAIGAYATTAAQGAAIGGLTATVVAPVGLAAAKYLPGLARTIGQETAIAHPQLTRLLEAARSVGRGAGARVRMTARELIDAIGRGGWPPGFRPAYAGGAVPARIATAPPDASVWVGVRALADLNAPMQMQGRGDDLVEVESVELGEEVEQMFNELSRAEHPEDGVSRLGEDGPEIDAVGMRSTRAKAGVVEEPGQVAAHQHHVFPEEYRAWFRDRGIDIDDYCVELTPPEHQAQHGGGNWRLARDVAKDIPDAEWNAGIMRRLLKEEAQKRRAYKDPTATLTRSEILEIGERYMDDRAVGGLPFQRYQR